MLRTRVWSALIALPALLVLILFAPIWLFSLIIIVLLIFGLYEVAEMTGIREPASLAALAAFAGVPAAAAFLAPTEVWWIPAVTFGVMTGLMASIARGADEATLHGIILAMLGAFWVGSLFPYFALLRNSSPDGVALTILMLLLVIASDSAAFFAGRSLGRMKLLPRVSPNKTVEGALGGLAGCIAVGLIFHSVLVPRWSIGQTVIFSVIVGVLAQLGDLMGSAIKRAAGVKDSGWIFPGHGGLLDRTCSLVFAAAFTYYYSR